jgi:hypothetical protein
MIAMLSLLMIATRSTVVFTDDCCFGAEMMVTFVVEQQRKFNI